jgi:Sulfatase
MIIIVVYASAAKHKAMDMVVHAYDIVFYLTSPSTLVFLWSEYRAQMVQLIIALAAFIASVGLAYRVDGTRISRWIAIPALFAFAALTGTAAIMKGERRHTQQYWDDLVVSTFYSSWPETIETLWRGQLIEAATAGGGKPFVVPAGCDPAQKPPHVILIHQESIVPPEYFPHVSYDKHIDAMFRSSGGQLHKMRVETYGGASWLTEFSILAGISTYSFGGMRPFVQSLMAGKVHDTLPQSMARCGYRNTVFYPLNRNFVSNAKFYTAAGIPEIFDMKDQGAKTANERDHFYYGNMLKLLESHIRSSQQPLFSYIITMSGHGPYLKPYHPEVDVPGGGPGTAPEMHEYLRRLSMARMDLDALKSDLKTRFPNEKFLLVHYGDHQPVATRSYLGFGNVNAAEDVALAKDSPGFITYYAVEGINYTPPPLPDLETLDVPYLGTVMMDAAGLPLSEAHAERKRLMTLCHGRYDGCSPRAPILAFHRRLIDSGLLQVR